MSENDRKTTDYLYLSIYKALKERILTGQFKNGDSFPPERQLKDDYGTTHVTVRKALSLLVEEGYIERYSGKGTVVVYTRDRSPDSSSRPTRPLSIRFLVPSLDHHRQQILTDFRRRCDLDGIPLKVSVFLHEWEEAMLREAIADRTSLLIYEPESPSCHFEKLLDPVRDRLVLLGGYEPGSSFTEVRYDIRQGVRDSLNFLHSTGIGEVALVSWNGTRLGDAMSSAFRDAVQPAPMSNGMGLREGGKDAAGNILQRYPECRSFICANDLSAGGVLNHLEETGLKHGKDFTIIGCGNNPFSEVLGICSLGFNPNLVGRMLSGFLDDYCRRGFLEAYQFSVPLDLVLRRYATPTTGFSQ